MNSISTKAASGFRDFLPEEAAIRNRLLYTVSETAREFGFSAISMSACEKLEVLMGKGGGTENEKLIFQVLKRGDALSRALQQTDIAGNPSQLADLGLRFDLTLPLARYYARFRNDLPRPFKAFQFGPVWRAERAQRGRYREFVQCDLDVVGSSSISAEVEVIAACMQVFAKLKLDEVSVKINDRQILAGVGAKLGFSEAEWAGILVTVDKHDKIGSDGVLKELSEKTDKAAEIVGIFFGNQSASFADFREYAPEAVDAMENLVNVLKTTAGGNEVVFQPNLVRGQDYYTGTIFEFHHPASPGSLGGGGRYDKLLAMFGNESIPCCGGSIGFERLQLVLQEQNKLANFAKKTDAMFVLFSQEDLQKIYPIAANLRASGLKIDVYAGSGKIKQQFKYADQIGCRFVLIAGDQELKNGEIKLKNMKTGDEQCIKQSELTSTLEQLCRN